MSFLAQSFRLQRIKNHYLTSFSVFLYMLNAWVQRNAHAPQPAGFNYKDLMGKGSYDRGVTQNHINPNRSGVMMTSAVIMIMNIDSNRLRFGNMKPISFLCSVWFNNRQPSHTHSLHDWQLAHIYDGIPISSRTLFSLTGQLICVHTLSTPLQTSSSNTSIHF